MTTVTELRRINERLGDRIRELNEKNLALRLRNDEQYRELRQLRKWWRALQAIAQGEMPVEISKPSAVNLRVSEISAELNTMMQKHGIKKASVVFPIDDDGTLHEIHAEKLS